MKLYVMRHGAAEDAAVSFHDFDRALTLKGRKKTREVARLLQHDNESPHLILSSPLVRALQTAEVVASVVDPEELVLVRQELAPSGNALGLVQELAASRRKSVMIVGHEPDLSSLVHDLVGDAWDRGLLKSMVLCLRLDDKHEAKLRFVLDPKSLAISHVDRRSDSVPDADK